MTWVMITQVYTPVKVQDTHLRFVDFVGTTSVWTNNLWALLPFIFSNHWGHYPVFIALCANPFNPFKIILVQFLTFLTSARSFNRFYSSNTGSQHNNVSGLEVENKLWSILSMNIENRLLPFSQSLILRLSSVRIFSPCKG